MVAEKDPERTPDEVLNFWFVELPPEDWFKQKDENDQTIILRFQLLHEQAAAGELKEWRSSIHGCLAEIILLDQFPRNMHRG